MNILVDAFPTSVTIAHTEYQIETGFRTCLLTILACEPDSPLTPQEKQAVMMLNLYPVQPHDIDAALITAIWFLNGGKDDDETTGNGPRLFSFAKDQQLIFAAFRQTHGIDLSKADLHWWEFLALFMDLGQDTTFCQITALRKRVLTGTASKEEKAAAQAMGETFRISQPDTRTLEEKEREREFLRLVELGQKKKGTQ